MRFKPGNTVERVLDQLNSSMNNSVIDSPTKFFTANSSPSRFTGFNGSKNTRVSPKALLLPELHTKTHFKGATSILL